MKKWVIINEERESTVGQNTSQVSFSENYYLPLLIGRTPFSCNNEDKPEWNSGEDPVPAVYKVQH